MKDKERNFSVQNREWIESLEQVFKHQGSERVNELLSRLRIKANQLGVKSSDSINTPYINTIKVEDQEPYPGNLEYEKRISNIVRWNAMAMVVRANRENSGLGGHISTYASACTLYEVGFNHFWRAANKDFDGDLVYFQGHASPGIYARAFVEGRLSGFELENFRREFAQGGGLPSYPHPRSMPEFWQFPTVSMGLAPIMSIYQARFNKYLESRGLKETSDQKIWAMLGDGEMDEPESTGAISLAGRDKLDNLIFVVNCNLQRLDGPVRGNSSIVQELESLFKGAGWNVIKVLWGSDWDVLFDKDTDGLLTDQLGKVPDGQMQKYAVEGGAYIRKDFFQKHEKLLALVHNYSDEQIAKLHRGGHDSIKVYAAYKSAVEHKGSPTIILAQTIKGYGLGESGEGRNITHQQKKLNQEELLEFRSHFAIPIPDGEVQEAPFYRPYADSDEMIYLKQQREKLGGYIPKRRSFTQKLELPENEVWSEFIEGSGDRESATTMTIVRIMAKLLKDKKIGERVVPIVPDEARTFGMESLFRNAGIYSPEGQLYEPVDKGSLLYYNEQPDGAILEEGITEAGSMSSFIAAGTSFSTHDLVMMPFYIFYSIFGWHRMMDLIWAAGDAKARGFLIGGISGRTTLAGEGLQHQDGHGHLFALAVPNLRAYDPAYSYELAIIVRDGMRRMYERGEDVFYYISVMNEFYKMPAMPQDSEEGIIRGCYKLQSAPDGKEAAVHLLGSGAILNEVVKASQTLWKQYSIPADVWSVTSYKCLYDDAIAVERNNLLNPAAEKKMTYIEQCFKNSKGVFVAASDYIKALPTSISKWLRGRFVCLGTDGYGRSETRSQLRDYFEVDQRYISIAAIKAMADDGKLDAKTVSDAIEKFGIAPK